MARPLRIQYPGAVYHVTCRGNERRDIFRDDEDRRTFLGLLTRSLNIYTVNLYAYVSKLSGTDKLTSIAPPIEFFENSIVILSAPTK
jgi:hypothetical protein